MRLSLVLRGERNRIAIFVLRILMEMMIEMQKVLYMCFIDYEKAFDTAKHDILIYMLQRIGVEGNDK